jgi:FAD/FMN-containing dehydrogenase
MVENELLKILGRENILDSPEVLKEYSSDGSFAPPHTPARVVRPAGLEELQEVVRWANEKRVPLVPVSSGPPHSRGDTVPGAEGGIIVDLRRMHKILRINQANRVAII